MSNGINEIFNEYRKRNNQNDNTKPDSMIKNQEGKANEENNENAVQYIVANSPEKYSSQKITKRNISNIQNVENRIVLKVNGIVIVSATIDPSSSVSYSIKEAKMQDDEEAFIELYEKYYKLSNHIKINGSIYDLLNSIEAEIDRFSELLSNQKNNTVSYSIRPEIVSYYMIKKYIYFEITPLLFDSKIENITGIENSNVIIKDSNYDKVFSTNIYLDRNSISNIAKRFSNFESIEINSSILDMEATLPDESRFNGIYNSKKSGTISFHIVKKKKQVSIQKLIENKTGTVDEFAFLSWILSKSEIGKIGILGLQNSSKSNLVKSITSFIPNNSTVFSIEGFPELYMENKLWIENKNVFKEENQYKLLNASIFYNPDFLFFLNMKNSPEIYSKMLDAINIDAKAIFNSNDYDEKGFIDKIQNDFEISKSKIANIKYLISTRNDKEINKKHISAISEIYGYDEEKDKILYQNLLSINLKQNGQKEIEEDYILDSFDKGLYDKFVSGNNIVDLQNSNSIDILLAMLLKSKNIEKYVINYNKEEQNTEYSIPQLRYAKDYMKIYNQMKDLRKIIADDYVRYENTNDEENKEEFGINLLTQDYQKYLIWFVLAINFTY